MEEKLKNFLVLVYLLSSLAYCITVGFSFVMRTSPKRKSRFYTITVKELLILSVLNLLNILASSFLLLKAEFSTFLYFLCITLLIISIYLEIIVLLKLTKLTKFT